MAKKTRRGQKQCPTCETWVTGTRAKSCPKCGHSFTNGQKRTVAVEAATIAAPVAAAGTAAKPANTITLEQIKAVSQTVKAIGGVERLNQTLDLIREVGGAKKFKDLVEAITQQ